MNGTETWQVYGPNGELLVEYAPLGAANNPQKEYGYRNDQLLVTAEPRTGGGGGGGVPQNVTWTNAVGVSVNGNSLTKTTVDTWGNGGAASTQTINSGDGYVEFTATENTTARVCGLSDSDIDQNYNTIDFGLAPYYNGALYVFESGANFQIRTYSPGDTLRVAIEGGVVKYRQNGNVIHTSTTSPTYPLRADTSFYTMGATVTNAVISTSGSGGGSSSGQVRWLVSDQLGTPRMIFDESGALANMSRHDYLPFGEELPGGFRTGIASYAAGDGVRQKFTEKERDIETGLDYFVNRHYGSVAGRFTSVDPYDINVERQVIPDAEEADAVFHEYLAQPQHWNHYADTGGFNSWVNRLTANPNDFRTMVNGFVNSSEYRSRFGPL